MLSNQFNHDDNETSVGKGPSLMYLKHQMGEPSNAEAIAWGGITITLAERGVKRMKHEKYDCNERNERKPPRY